MADDNERDLRPRKEPALQVKKVKLTRAEYMRNWRKQRKMDQPELYRKDQDYNNLRLRVFRSNLSEDTKKAYQEKTNVRVRKNRANKPPAPTEQKPRTRIATKVQQKVWADAQASYRVKQNPQTKRRVKERRRKLYAERYSKAARMKKLQPQTPMTEETLDEDVPSTSNVPSTSKATLRKAASRAKKALPISGKQYAEVLTRLVMKATPKRKQLMKQQGLVTSPVSRKFLEFTTNSIKETVARINKKRNTKSLQQKRILAKALQVRNKYSSFRKHYGIGYKTLKKTADGEIEVRKRRKDALPLATRETVVAFYNRDDISSALPDARSAKKTADGEVKACRVMNMTLLCTYQRFSAAYADMAMSFSMFKLLRPSHVVTMANHKRRNCLCEYCVNIEFKLKAIANVKRVHGLGPSPFLDKYDISRKTLCAKVDGKEYRSECLNRKCEKCGFKQLLKDLQPLHTMEEATTWLHWETAVTEYDGRKVRRMVKEKKQGKVKDMVEELQRELEPFSLHLFNASWQWRQYNAISTDMPEGHVVFCMDFAENYACRSQDEAQGAHWSNIQATIHPVVASYRCTVPGCQDCVTDSMMMISDDQKHCPHAVQHYNKVAVEHLQAKGVSVNKLIHYTDGAPTQYKNKTSFADASLSATKFGYGTEKNFFGSRHGKGPCDREIGVLKKSVNLAINARRTEVGGANDLYIYGRDHLTRPATPGAHVHSLRSFFFVKQGSINRVRPECADVETLKGTMSLHCVRGEEQPYKVVSRQRSCFCQPCITSNGTCKNGDVTGPWKTTVLKKQSLMLISQSVKEVAEEDATDMDADKAINLANDKEVPDLDADVDDDKEVPDLDADVDDAKEVPDLDADVDDAKDVTELDADVDDDKEVAINKATDVNDETSRDKQQPSINSYVAVHFPEANKGGKAIAYMAMVTEIPDNGVRLKFIRRNKGLYTFTAER